MSGGSYDYLFRKDPESFFDHEETLERMADRLSKLGYADAAAQETLWILLEMRAFRNKVEVVKNRLRNVWQAVEWWDSCDSGEKELREALDKYNGTVVLEDK